VERQQTKWIVYGTAIALLGFMVLAYLLGPTLRLLIPLPRPGLLLTIIAVTSIYLLLLLIPLSLAFAIQRYRLWDVDILINKTLVYSLLTGILVAIYAVSIISLQILLQGLLHQTSQVAIVASTLIIASIFTPLRRAIQAIIDRRFYRRKYHAARTLAAFSANLRNEVDLSRLTENLLAVVQETMQPTHISLWLRTSESPLDRNTQLLPPLDESKDEAVEQFQ
jgi:hypothetical protein